MVSSSESSVNNVANILISNGKVLKLYDWIELPSSNISGEVIDIALHTITVRNWDNTISRIPTKDFLTEKYTHAFLSNLACTYEITVS